MNSLDNIINHVKEHLFSMSDLIKKMLRLGHGVLLKHNLEWVDDVSKLENQVNGIQISLDRACVQALALYQPEASDLRTIVSIIKINSDLERIADQVFSLTQICKNMSSYTHNIKSLQETKMYELAELSVNQSIMSFKNKDVALCRTILFQDDAINNLKDQMIRQTVYEMQINPDKVEKLVKLMTIVKSIEKIGDHATNIAENVIFMIIGKDIRHHNTV